jgi:SAM-dependent methyltransferase
MIKLLRRIDTCFFQIFFKLYLTLNKYYVQKYLKKNIYINKIYTNKQGNTLSKLFAKYNSDKGYLNLENNKFLWIPHTYDTIYYDLFIHCKDSIKLVFECGIGSGNKKYSANMGANASPGASLRAWRDFFSKATIYGADIDSKVLFTEKRIKTYEMNQLDPNSIKNMWKKINKINFDIIIDDGMHSHDSSLIMFNNCFSKLRPGGIYFIEDVNYRYLKKLKNSLTQYNPLIIELTSKEHNYHDNNMIIIRKNNY